jgi:chromosome partitioning protein
VVDEAVAVIRREGGEVSSVIIRQRVAFQHCLTDGRTAAEFEPGGAAAQEIADLHDDMMKCLHEDVSTRDAA